MMGSSEVASDDVAAMLRESLRGFLDVHWRALGLKDAASPEAVSAICASWSSKESQRWAPIRTRVVFARSWW